MAFTLGAVIADSRRDLNDAAGRRWATADMEKMANDAVQEIITLRPDLIFGSIATGIPTLASSDIVPLPDSYQNAINTYIKSQAYQLNTDRGSFEKANALYSNFAAIVKGL